MTNRTLCSNDRMLVTYDIPSPRPHLIVLLKNDKECNSVDNFISKYDVLSSIMELAKQCPLAKILSLHTGYWYKARNFHVHLVLNTEDYINQFNLAGITLSSADKTREWTFAKEPLGKSYLENVKHYSKKQLEKSTIYKNDDLDMIQKLQNNNFSHSVPRWEMKNVELVFHSNEPKIGFKSTISDQIIIFQAMVDFSKFHGFFNKDKGAHICLFLNDLVKQEHGFSKDVLGYVLTTGIEYYKLFKDNNSAEIWKNNYSKNSNFNVLT